MNLVPVFQLLEQRIGLNPEALSPSAIPEAVAARMRERGLDDPAAYADLLARDADEFQELTDRVVVPETWFFRGGGLFDYLADQIGRVARSRPAGPPVRALCVPCSTGEEPYSLAIALKRAGVPVAARALLGVDLSRRGISRARKGCYRDFSFRQNDPELRRRYFRPAGGRWRIDDDLRAAVEFRKDNLLAPLFLAGEAPFDLVLCRNLFIYLVPAARQQALTTLTRLLAPEGLLGLGHADPPDGLPSSFRRVGPEEFFLFRRDAGAPGAVIPRAAGAVVVPRERTPGRGTRPIQPSVKAAPIQENSPEPPPVRAADPLAEARGKADRGELDQALAGCRESLARTGPSAEVYCLMGIIHEAQRETEQALECFRKALYLEPGHREALLHLMLLYRQRGDEPRAALLRRRLERDAAGGEP